MSRIARWFSVLAALVAFTSPLAAQDTPTTSTSQPSTSGVLPGTHQETAQTVQAESSSVIYITENLGPSGAPELEQTESSGGITVLKACSYYECYFSVSGGSSYSWRSNWQEVGTGANYTLSFGGWGLYDLTLFVNGARWNTWVFKRGEVPDNRFPTPPTLTFACDPYASCTTTTSTSDPDGKDLWIEWDWQDDGTYDQGGVWQNSVGRSYAGQDSANIRIGALDPGYLRTWSSWWVFPQPPAPSFSQSCNRSEQEGWFACLLQYDGSGRSPDTYVWYVRDVDGSWRRSVAENLTEFRFTWWTTATVPRPVYLKVTWGGYTMWYIGSANPIPPSD